MIARAWAASSALFRTARRAVAVDLPFCRTSLRRAPALFAASCCCLWTFAHLASVSYNLRSNGAIDVLRSHSAAAIASKIPSQVNVDASAWTGRPASAAAALVTGLIVAILMVRPISEAAAGLSIR